MKRIEGGGVSFSSPDEARVVEQGLRDIDQGIRDTGDPTIINASTGTIREFEISHMRSLLRDFVVYAEQKAGADTSAPATPVVIEYHNWYNQ